MEFCEGKQHWYPLTEFHFDRRLDLYPFDDDDDPFPDIKTVANDLETRLLCEIYERPPVGYVRIGTKCVSRSWPGTKLIFHTVPNLNLVGRNTDSFGDGITKSLDSMACALTRAFSPLTYLFSLSLVAHRLWH
jgi:hypothetical protein